MEKINQEVLTAIIICVAVGFIGVGAFICALVFKAWWMFILAFLAAWFSYEWYKEAKNINKRK